MPPFQAFTIQDVIPDHKQRNALRPQEAQSLTYGADL
jgi:hypothetical protein